MNIGGHIHRKDHEGPRVFETSVSQCSAVSCCCVLLPLFESSACVCMCCVNSMYVFLCLVNFLVTHVAWLLYVFHMGLVCVRRGLVCFVCLAVCFYEGVMKI